MLVSVRGDGDRLTRRVVEGVAVEPEPREARARRGGHNLADREREHGGLCYLTVRLKADTT